MTNPNAQKMAEDILNMLAGWEVVDKNDPDYQLFAQDIAAYLSKAAALSEAVIDRQARALEVLRPIFFQTILDAVEGLTDTAGWFEVSIALNEKHVEALRVALAEAEGREA